MICLTVYVETKTNDYGVWYRLNFSSDGSPAYTRWNGPYRDTVDAENAVEDEAMRNGYNLEWRY